MFVVHLLLVWFKKAKYWTTCVVFYEPFGFISWKQQKQRRKKNVYNDSQLLKVKMSLRIFFFTSFSRPNLEKSSFEFEDDDPFPFNESYPFRVTSGVCLLITFIGGIWYLYFSTPTATNCLTDLNIWNFLQSY